MGVLRRQFFDREHFTTMKTSCRPYSSLRCEAMEQAFSLLDEVKSPFLCEVGRTREVDSWESDGWSTIHFATYATKHKGLLVSIDADPVTKPVCQVILHELGMDNPSVLYFNVQRDKFVAPQMKGVHLLLLDAVDCLNGSEEFSATWHLSCLKFLEPCIAPGGLLMVDDCFSGEFDKVRGKGKYVIPYAVNELRYKPVVRSYAWLLRKPV